MEKIILIVDDEKPIVDVLKFNLEKDGYKTIEAYDGEQAVEMALTAKPDLIILDVMLPKMDAFTVCKKIRQKLFFASALLFSIFYISLTHNILVTNTRFLRPASSITSPPFYSFIIISICCRYHDTLLTYA